jgi:hypothetical protein
MTDASIELDSWLHGLLAEHTPQRPWKFGDGGMLRSLELHRLLRLPLYSREPRTHLAEMLEEYVLVLHDLSEVRKRLAELNMPPPSKATNKTVVVGRWPTKHEAQLIVVQGMLLTIALFFNKMLRCFALYTEEQKDLASTQRLLIQYVLTLSESMLPLRPLWSEGFIMTSVIAWTAAKDLSEQQMIEKIMALYTRPHLLPRAIEHAQWMRTRFDFLAEHHLTSSKAYADNHVGDIDIGLPDMEPVAGECVMM